MAIYRPPLDHTPSLFYNRAMKRTIEQFTEKDIERFWSKVDKRKIEECWEWQGTRDRYYGVFAKYTPETKGANHNYLAHRVAFFLYHNLTESNKIVCHRCDNCYCCNPHHLYLGSHHDNAQDMMKRNRYAKRRGVLNTQTKLSEKAVIEIREEIDNGAPPKKIASFYNVSVATIYDIKAKRSWSHI